MGKILADFIAYLTAHIFRASKPKMEEGAEAGKREDRLRDQLKKERWTE